MGHRTVHDPRGSNAVLVDKMLGNAYEVVRHVAQYIEYVKHVSAHMEQVYRVNSSVEGVDAIAEKLTEIDTIFANIASISAVAPESENIKMVGENITSVLSVQQNLAMLVALHEEMTKLVALAEEIPEMVELHAQIAPMLTIHESLEELLDLHTNLENILALDTRIDVIEDWVNPSFDSVALLLNSTAETLGPVGQIVEAGGFQYKAHPAGVIGPQYVFTAGGVPLEVLLTGEGCIPADAFDFPGPEVDCSALMAQVFAYEAALAFDPVPGLSGTAAALAPWIEFSARQYYWETPITLPSRCFVKGNNCVFTGPAGGRLFNGPSNGYSWVFDDVVWAGDDTEAVFADMNNINNAVFLFRRNTFAGRVSTLDKFAIRIKSQSSRVTLEDCRGSVCPNVLETDTDFTYINGGWYQGWINLAGIGNAAPTGARFKVAGRFLHLSGGVCIPEPQGSTRQPNARWIDRVGSTRIYAENWHFGAENAGFPIIYNFANAAYDGTTGRQPSIISLRDCQIACGSSQRPDAGVIVLQDGILPGWVDVQNCESLGQASIISAHGYDPDGDETTQNAALEAALLAAPAIRHDMQIAINEPFQNKVPLALRGYVRQPDGRKATQKLSPAAATAIPVVDGVKILPNNSGARSHDTFFVRVSVNCGMPSSRTLYQEKVFKVTILSNGTGNLASNVAVDDFFEWARFGAPDDVGDVLITLAQRSGPSDTLIGFDVTLADEVVGSYQSMQVEVYGQNRSFAATGTRALVPCLL